jgi:DNA (cytosine-5)-methyltransferase 1
VSFTFVDLFAGIGGFHLALQQLGGKAVFASEIDPHAQEIYRHNFEHHMHGEILGDIVPLTESVVDDAIPVHDVLAAGFPCQPFSKSGFQRGINETRGTLFYNIARVLEAKRPRVVILENVRNLVGPNHRHTWHLIRKTLRDLGYRTPDQPTVFSPHLMPGDLLGAPQVRERVFIVAVYVGNRAWEFTEDPLLAPNKPVSGWLPQDWDLEGAVLQQDDDIENLSSFHLTDAEIDLIALWDDFLQSVGEAHGNRLPGHPLWADYFVTNPEMGDWPDWKVDFVSKNSAFYRSHRHNINRWRKRHRDLEGIPESRRKLEWQAQDMESIWDGLIQFRPSGIRVKKPNYVPALVAMNQTSIIGPRKRRLTVREGARLQGFPDSFSFADQVDARSFKQLGNAVSVGAATQVLSQAVYLWDFFPEDIAIEIRKARVDHGLLDVPLHFGANEGGQ